MRLASSLTLLLVALAVLAGSANANVIIWKVSLSGSYRSDGSVTNQECGDDYKTPMTATATETGTLRTNKSTLFDAWHAGKKPELAIQDDTKPLRLAGAITRTSGLQQRDEPNGCNNPAKSLDCDTRGYGLEGTLYGIPHGGKLRVELGLGMGNGLKLAGGPWQSCPLAIDQGGMPFWTNPKNVDEGLNPPLEVPVGKLFAKHPKPFTAKGTLARSGGTTEGRASSQWSYRFDYELKFTFAGRA